MSDEFNTFFQSIDTLGPSDSRQSIVRFLKEQAIELRGSDNQSAEIAYHIAGIMSTDFARNLGQNDPLNAIFTIAVKLEIDPPNRSELRDELILAIKLL